MGIPVYKRILDLFEAEGVNTLFGIPGLCIGREAIRRAMSGTPGPAYKARSRGV